MFSMYIDDREGWLEEVKVLNGQDEWMAMYRV